MKELVRKHPYLSLLVIGILSGALWRFELEYHGWGGLDWLAYFHYAVPIGLVLFTLWLNLYLSMDLRKRIAVNLLSLVTAYAHFYWLIYAATKAYSRSPFTMLDSFTTASWVRHAYEYSILFIPTVFGFLVISFFRRFKIKRAYWRLLLFNLAIVASLLFAILLLEITNHRGGSDDIHALKSGFIIPFLFLSLGILVVKKTPILANEKHPTTKRLHDS